MHNTWQRQLWLSQKPWWMLANRTTETSVTDTWWNVLSFPQQGFSRRTCAVRSWLLFAVRIVAGLSQSVAMYSLTISGPEGWHTLFLFISFSALWRFSFKPFTGNQKLNENLEKVEKYLYFKAGNCTDWSIQVQSINKWTAAIFCSPQRWWKNPQRGVQSYSHPLSYQCQIRLKGFKCFDFPSIHYSRSIEQQGNDRFAQLTAYPCNQSPDCSIPCAYLTYWSRAYPSTCRQFLFIRP